MASLMTSPYWFVGSSPGSSLPANRSPSKSSRKQNRRHHHFCHQRHHDRDDKDEDGLDTKFDTLLTLSGHSSTSSPTIPPAKRNNPSLHKQPHHHRHHHGNHLSTKRSVFFILILYLITTTLADEHVCTKSIKIRNNASYFHELENCTVIEGSLEVVLIDNGKVEDYQNLTFPKLREVTDYVLFYRAAGLTSIGRLFPNLSVIRGRHLFLNYALTIYDMKQLIEIGLNNLTSIERGNVRIEKNPHLCFADTINWDIITNSKGAHKIGSNKKLSECPSCPEVTCPIGNPTSGKPSSPLCWNPENCQRVCDSKCKNGCMVGNHSECCHEECLGGCSGKNSTDCIACKHVTHRGNCYPRCKSIVGEETQYEFMGRRCVTFDECIQSRSVKNKVHNGKCISECPAQDGLQNDPHDNHRCRLCPKGKCPKMCVGGKIESIAHAQNFKGCTVIEGSLEISVRGDGNIVTELESSLENLDTITGYLKIMRSYPLITFHFLKNLRRIEGHTLDRNDYSLVVMDNPNLQELFAWNASNKLIIERGKIFFHINPLLCMKEIRKLLTVNGVAEIKSLEEQKFDDYDVSRLSNGDKTACDLTDLDLRIDITTHRVATITWNDYKRNLNDPRELLGYLIYYKKATGNVSMFDGRDACTDTEWSVVDYEANEDTKKYTNNETSIEDTKKYTNNETSIGSEPVNRIMQLIPGLEPASRYAMYIKTYTIASAEKGGISDIKYFVTEPHKPEQPMDVMMTAQSLGKITIKWNPPRKPNGKIVTYLIQGVQDLSNIEAYRNVDHCSEKSIGQKVLPSSPTSNLNPSFFNDTNGSSRNNGVDSFISTILPTKNSTIDGVNCCACKKISINAADEADDLIAFENALQNMVYIKREISPVSESLTSFAPSNSSGLVSSSRKRRSIATESKQQKLIVDPRTNNISTNSLSTNSLSTNSLSTNDTIDAGKEKKPVAHNFSYEVNATDGENTLTVEDLRHYAQYSIKIIACQKRNDDSVPEMEKKCSKPNENNINTQPKKGADDIKLVNVSGSMNGSQYLIIASWDEPEDPNGMIVTYHVEYFRDLGGSKSSKCLKRSEFVNQKNEFILPYDLQPGEYSLRVKARSLASDGNWSPYITFKVPDHRSMSVWAIVSIAVIAGLLVMVFAAASTWFFFRKFHDDPPPNLQYVSMNPEYMPAYEPDEWEISRDKTKLIRELGQGSFGMVYQGELYDYDGRDVMPCAIKTVNDRASAVDKIEFLQEASTMKSFNNHHVVKLLGVVSTSNPVFVCMELMAKGDLKNYLRGCRDDSVSNGDKKQSGGEMNPKPSIKQVHLMATQIADGMAYLAAEKFVHRDLAGRNCMVADDLTVKIGDFGMTRDIYDTDYYRKGGKGLLPVRWMAPESLKDGIFTSQSDVWSFGVVLWEIVTLAQQPYQGLSNEQVLKFVLRGGTQDKPEKCPEHLFTIMSLCWNWNPKGRPTFTEIIEMLFSEIEKDAAEQFQKVSHYHNHVPSPIESMDTHETSPLTTGLDRDNDLHDGTGSGDIKVKFFPSIVGARPDEEKVQVENDDNSNPTNSNPKNSNPTNSNSTNSNPSNSNLTNSNPSNSNPSNSNLTPTGNGISQTTPSRTNGVVIKTGESNKSSEGSRESKISNGSVANGHATHHQVQGAAKC